MHRNTLSVTRARSFGKGFNVRFHFEKYKSHKANLRNLSKEERKYIKKKRKYNHNMKSRDLTLAHMLSQAKHYPVNVAYDKNGNVYAGTDLISY